MKLGIFQCDCDGQNATQRLATLRDALIGASLDMVVCPELFATGYHINTKHAELAEASDGAFAKDVKSLAGETGTAICYGYAEAAGDDVYNSAALICPEAGLLTNHRKRLPAPGSFEERTFSNGAELNRPGFTGE